MASTELLTAGNYSCKQWLPGIRQVQSLPGWTPKKEILVWVDNGSSWVRTGTVMPNVPVVTNEYEELAALTPQVLE